MKKARRLSFIVLPLLAVLIVMPLTESLAANAQQYFFNTTVNTGRNNGYSGQNPLERNDIHYGWRLGSFVISGYTRVVFDEQGNPVFLKNLGDRITLSFLLEQDIVNLNGNNRLSINEDKNGFDQYFEVERTNFGRGALITRHTDYQNIHRDTTYFDYLPALTTNANTTIELLEEGDYEVALNYEIKHSSGGFLFINSYENYRMFFQFSVRNGNCSVFPFDVVTRSELANNSITENGFRLDLARSRYLDIDVRKKVLLDGSDELTADARFNLIAKSGDIFTEHGIYTITARNRYTGERAERKIYVGTNNILKAYMRTGYSIREILQQQEFGAQIMNDGTIIPPPTDSTVFALDMQTKALLTDNSFTENGFILHLEEAQHLDIIVIREVLTNAADGLVRDTQFNTFASEGVEYTAEGIYTIIAINRSSEQLSSMRIGVGANPILKAHIKTGYSVREINEQIALGAQITDDGEIISPALQSTETVSQPDESSNNNYADSSEEETLSNNKDRDFVIPVLIGVALALIAGIIFVLSYHKRRQSKTSKILNENSVDADREDERK
jgi:hypothetical protein